MNGLRYIRKRCNFSLNELAKQIGVSRQALSSWENERKEIPEQRLNQLESFFGIERKYIGEISDEDVLQILGKAMFRYDEGGKETYRFKPPVDIASLENVPIYFWNERSMSFDEEYVLALKRKQEVLEHAHNIVKWTDNAGSVQSQIGCINRGCFVYEMINDLMEEMRRQKSYMKVPFYYELINVWRAMMLAYGLVEKEQIEEDICQNAQIKEDLNWILELSNVIQTHWDQQKTHHEDYRKRVRGGKKDYPTKTEENSQLSFEEKIENMEKIIQERLRNDELGIGKGVIYF